VLYVFVFFLEIPICSIYHLSVYNLFVDCLSTFMIFVVEIPLP